MLPPLPAARLLHPACRSAAWCVKAARSLGADPLGRCEGDARRNTLCRFMRGRWHEPPATRCRTRRSRSLPACGGAATRSALNTRCVCMECGCGLRPHGRACPRARVPSVLAERRSRKLRSHRSRRFRLWPARPNASRAESSAALAALAHRGRSGVRRGAHEPRGHRLLPLPNLRLKLPSRRMLARG